MPAATDPTTELLKAIRSRLRADATLTTAFGAAAPVFEYIKRNQDMPYIVMREISQQADNDDQGLRGKIHLVQLRFHDAERTSANVRVWMRAAELSLDRATFTVTGHTLVNATFQSGFVDREPQGRGFRGVQRYRFVTEETA